MPLSCAESKVLRYILPAFPAFSLLAAQALAKWLTPTFLKRFVLIVYGLLGLVGIVMASLPNYRSRATEMKMLAPLATTQIPSQQRVLLYTAGQYQWDYRNQLLWYGDRLCWHLRRVETLLEAVACDPQTVVIMDSNSFEKLNGCEAAQWEILGRSANFVCFRQQPTKRGPALAKSEAKSKTSKLN